MDNFKVGLSPQSFSVRECFRLLQQSVPEGAYLNKYTKVGDVELRVVGGDLKKLPQEFDKEKRDNQIIATALRIMAEEKKLMGKACEVILVSKDNALRLAANSLKIKTQDYRKDKIQNQDIFSGAVNTEQLSDTDYEYLKLQGKITFLNSIEMDAYNQNDFIKIRDLNCVVRNKRKIKEDEHIDIEVIEPENCWDIKPKNDEQEFAMWLLNNKDIQLVALSGIAGSGKSILALASALKQTIDKALYKKIIIIRPTVPVGRDIGFLPGDLESKLDPWTQAIKDAMSVIMEGEDATKTQYLFDSGIIEFAPMTFIRGRTFNNTFMLVAETQNTTRLEIKSILSRAGYKSKIVIDGDLDQIDGHYIDKYSCGLAHVIQAFKGQKIFGHCNMITSERSELAGLAAKLL